MDFQNDWEKALKETQIIRSRIKQLMTTSDTQVPYVLLSHSSINLGDTVVRRGEVKVSKPAIILPPHAPQFTGFEFEQEGSFHENMVLNFLMVRGISMPSLKYNNNLYTVDVHSGDIDRALSFYRRDLEQKEDVHTGLVLGPDDCWQFSLLLYICTQVVKNAESDIRHLLERYRKDHSS